MVEFSAHLIDSNVSITNLRKSITRNMTKLKLDLNICMTNFNSSKKHTNDAIVTLSGKISQAEQILGARIDGLQANLGIKNMMPKNGKSLEYR